MSSMLLDEKLELIGISIVDFRLAIYLLVCIPGASNLYNIVDNTMDHSPYTFRNRLTVDSCIDTFGIDVNFMVRLPFTFQ